VKVFVNVGNPLTKPDDAKRSVVVAAFKFGIILLELRKSNGLGIICNLCDLPDDAIQVINGNSYCLMETGLCETDEKPTTCFLNGPSGPRADKFSTSAGGARLCCERGGNNASDP
jgi:hypothetical protein